MVTENQTGFIFQDGNYLVFQVDTYDKESGKRTTEFFEFPSKDSRMMTEADQFCVVRLGFAFTIPFQFVGNFQDLEGNVYDLETLRTFLRKVTAV